MARPALIGIGGPVVAALVEQLGAVPGLPGRVELHLVPGLPPPPALLARARVVLDEAGSLDQAARAALSPGCAVIRLPRLAFASLWPLATAHPPRPPDIPAIPAPFGDRIALAALHAAPAYRRAAYDAAPLDEDLDARHDAEARDLFRREADADIRVAAFVLARFRQERLFHSPVHPAGALLHQVMAQLLGHPALAALTDARYDAALRAVAPGLAPLFADAQAPIHPAVAAHFGLAWWSPALRYRQGDALRSFGEWVDWHLREPPPPPLLPPGRSLAALHDEGALPGAMTLQPAAELARVPPFFATAIDPGRARHGAALLSPDSARYRAGPILLAPLAEATVLGDTGAVLHRGAVLADTAPPGAQALRAHLPPRHHMPGRALLAFGPGWRNDPHGIATLLPRLLACARLRRQDPALRALLPQSARANHPCLSDMLALLGLDTAVDWLPDEPVACPALLVTGRFDTSAIAPFAIEAARALAALVPLAPPGPRLLHLRSADPAATPANAAEIDSLLASLGFAPLDTGATPLPQRLALLRNAAAIVAAQGPALAEIAACAPGAAVLELVGPADPSPTWWSIASCAGLRYGYIVGDPCGASFHIPPAMLAAAVGRMAPGER